MRIEAFDVAKVLGLMLVCYGHFSPITNIDQVFYSFHIPLFFIIGGVFFNIDKFSLRKSAQRLLIPYVFYNLIVAILGFFISYIHSGNFYTLHEMLNVFLGILCATSNHSAPYLPIGPSWFLIALFLVRCEASLIFKDKVKAAIIIIVQLIIFLLVKPYFLWYVFSLDSVALTMPFFYMGYLSRNEIVNMINKIKTSCVVPAVLFFGSILVALVLVNGKVEIYAGNYGNNIFVYLFAGCIGTLCVLILSTLSLIPAPILKNLSEGAILILCLHTTLADYMFILIGKLGLSYMDSVYMKIVLIFAIYCMCYPSIIFCKKYIPLMLGK